MNTRVAYTAPPAPGPYEGKRLSPWRVALGLAILVAIVAASLFGYRLLVVDQVRAVTGAAWFAPYVDVTTTPFFAFEKPENPADRDVVLSFVVAAAADSCTPSWGGYYDLEEAARDVDLDRRIARLRDSGGDVVLSFGGASGTELAGACTDEDALGQAYRSVIDRYDVSTIDLDVEGQNLEDPVSGLRRALAIADLQRERRAAGEELAVWLTLPVAPDGLTASARTAIAQMLESGVDLTGVNVMTMDYGVDLGAQTMADTAIDALRATHTQLGALYEDAGTPLTAPTLWGKLAATPMIGQNDVAGEVFTLDDAAALNAFAQQQRMSRLSMWSLNRDRTCGTNYADTSVVSNDCSGIDQQDATFAETLQPGFEAAPDESAGRRTTPEPVPTVTDDPAASPYPIWSETNTYLSGAKVVWRQNVYEAKWWTRGDDPDNPLADANSWPWRLIGPVLPGETPYPQPTLPAGTYPDWDPAATYTEGQRVMFQQVPYEAKYWTRGDSPAAQASDADGSPWQPLTIAQLEQVIQGGP